MSLIECAACGRQISERAPVCVQCGHPTGRILDYGQAPLGRPPEASMGARAVKVMGRLVLFGIGCIAIILMGAFIYGVLKGIGGNSEHPTAQTPPTPPPAAAFEVTDQLSDEECTQVGDYCIRVHCSFSNTGNAPGEEEVSARLLDGTAVVAERRSTLTLLPGRAQRVDFDFPEAELGDEHHYRYQCMAPH